MFEFEDSRLGKIKVISVTEARTSIATIMTDKSFNYVITKNNRPIRVIINYDTYRTYMAPLQTGRGLTKPPKGSIKGLIETREKELKDQVSRLESSPPLAQEIKKAVGEDFSELPAEPMDIPEPQMAESADPLPEEPAHSMAEPLTEPLAEPPAELPMQTIEEIPAAPEEPDYFGSRANSEQSDYFARFRKLYESPSRPSPTAARAAVAPPVFNPPPVRENIQPVVESPPEKRGKPEPPSIQDLLRELENTKLSGEE